MSEFEILKTRLLNKKKLTEKEKIDLRLMWNNYIQNLYGGTQKFQEKMFHRKAHRTLRHRYR